MKRTFPAKTVCLAASLAAVSGTILAARPAAAQTPAVGFTANAFGVEDDAADALGSPTGSFSLGFEFTANAPALVSSLGYFSDPSFDPAAPFNTVSLTPPAPAPSPRTTRSGCIRS